MFCPKCRIEFQDWVKTCRYCGVGTVAELPPGVHPASQDFDPYPYRQLPPLELHKPGNKKCPNCGKHQGWYRALGPQRWHSFPSHQWKCAGCQATLTYDYNRHMVLRIPFWMLLVISLLLLVGAFAEPALLIFLPVTVSLGILALWWAVAIVRQEENVVRTAVHDQRRSMVQPGVPLYRPGNHKCPNCGHPEGWNAAANFRKPWAEWRCLMCQSSLGLDVRRQVLAILAVPISGLVLGICLAVFDLGAYSWLLFLALLPVVVVLQWWSCSVRLKGTPGQPSPPAK